MLCFGMPDKSMSPSGVASALWDLSSKNARSPVYCHCFAPLPVVVLILYLCWCLSAAACSLWKVLPNHEIDTLQHNTVVYNVFKCFILSKDSV